jgi:hypothetical protein
MTGLGRARSCASLGWSSGWDSESGSNKSGIQGIIVDLGENNDNDVQQKWSAKARAGNEAKRGR